MIFSGILRLGRDAELRYTSSEKAVCNFTGAYDYGMKGDDGKRPSQWVNCAIWGKLAEVMQPYLVKGKQVWIAGEDAFVREYDKKDGTKGYSLEVTVTRVQLVGSRDEKPAEPKEDKPAPIKGSSKFDSLEDDIPF